jgi:hypothetical protein
MKPNKRRLIDLDLYETIEELTNTLNQIRDDLEDIEHRPSPVKQADIDHAIERIRWAEILTSHLMKARTGE